MPALTEGSSRVEAKAEPPLDSCRVGCAVARELVTVIVIVDVIVTVIGKLKPAFDSSITYSTVCS